MTYLLCNTDKGEDNLSLVLLGFVAGLRLEIQSLI